MTKKFKQNVAGPGRANLAATSDAMISLVRTVITLPSHMHAKAKQRAAELGISFAEFTRRLFEKELDTPMPQGDIDSICGMVKGAPFDMARDGRQIIAQATAALSSDGPG